jgi:hypothetical protein
MNQIQKRDRYAEETTRIREIVSRHPLPNFVTGFDVRLGEFDGDPAMWIAFKTIENNVDDARLQEQMAELEVLRKAVQADLLNEIEDRYPYFRFEEAEGQQNSHP